MNKGKISILEIFSVLLILAVLAIFLIPKATQTTEETKKEKYLKEVKEMVDNAKIMYQNNVYLRDGNYFEQKTNNSYTITLDKILNIKDYVDPFGYLYDKKETKITFINENTDTIIKVNIKSCKANKSDGVKDCYEIVDEFYDKLSEKSIKNTIH